MKDTMNNKNRKPRLAIMGEFSVGKSTLSNLLLEANPLPVKTTATQLPPIWLTYGEDKAERETISGDIEPVDINNLDSVDLDETRLIHVQLKSDILKVCDLIDMPGICDPNMDADVWKAVIGEADHVIWCTHATQAWRQSEVATWESLPQELHKKSLLLLTRFDKLLTTRDRDRVMKRVKREAKGLFRDIFPVSLIQALNAGEDSKIWEESGVEPFVKCLVDMLLRHGAIEGVSQRKSDQTTMCGSVHNSNPAESTSGMRISPTRVRAKKNGQRRERGVLPTNISQIDISRPAEHPGNG